MEYDGPLPARWDFGTPRPDRHVTGPHADLHVHTDRSDGQLSLEGVPAAASRAGVAIVALTDHDRFQPALAGPLVVREGVTLIHGIELRVDTGGQRVDLLGYGLEPTPALAEEVERLQIDRRRRGAAIIERVEARLGIDLDLRPGPGLGRPHIARAIEAHPDTPYDYRGAFEELIGAEGPCYVPRSVTPFESGRELLAEACAFVALAHPLRYRDAEAALELAASLDAVERFYPYEHDPDPAPVDRVIAEHDLLVTGGSDAHDDRIGRAGLTVERWEAIEARLPDPTGERG